MEWRENFEESAPNHRHMAHLLALFPFSEISPDATPKLAEAARVTIRRRTSQEDWEDTGWSRANLLLFAARLQDGAWAHQLIRGALHNLTETNLMVVHPPLAGAKRNVYELDGNTGVCTGIAVMLLQSHAGEIHLLPALPGEWARGAVRGLRARGGVRVDLAWEDGALVQVWLHADVPCNSTVRYRNVRVPMTLTPGNPVVLDRNLEETAEDIAGGPVTQS